MNEKIAPPRRSKHGNIAIKIDVDVRRFKESMADLRKQIQRSRGAMLRFGSAAGALAGSWCGPIGGAVGATLGAMVSLQRQKRAILVNFLNQSIVYEIEAKIGRGSMERAKLCRFQRPSLTITT